MTYYIEHENKIVLFDTDKNKLQQTQRLCAAYRELPILETERPIENFEWADTPEFLARKERWQKEEQVAGLEAATGLTRPMREIITAGQLSVSSYVQEKVQEIEALAAALRAPGEIHE